MRWPYAPVEFRKDGRAAFPEQAQAARALLAPGRGVTDLLFVAHGWNNDLSEAEELFTELCDNAADRVDRLAPQRRVAVVGLLWPAVRWADPDQVAGGGLSAGDELPALLDAIAERVEDQQAAAELSRLAGRLDQPDARARFVRTLRTLLPDDAHAGEDDPVPPALRSGDEQVLFERAAEAERDVVDAEDGLAPAAAGGAAALPPGLAPDLLAAPVVSGAGFDLSDLDPRRLARRLLNLTTYYTMKARAGDVGQRGVAPLLQQLHADDSAVRLHLAGHSFGARVVTAAAAATTAPVSSLTLLQAAFSHWSFSPTTNPPGAFRTVLSGDGLRGPVVVTHTHNDKPVLLAYAVASRLANQVSSGIGDASDPYGGLGANGAVATAGVEPGELGGADARYRFRPKRIHNLLADQYVSGHGDVRDRPVANALVHAMLASDA